MKKQERDKCLLAKRQCRCSQAQQKQELLHFIEYINGNGSCWHWPHAYLHTLFFFLFWIKISQKQVNSNHKVGWNQTVHFLPPPPYTHTSKNINKTIYLFELPDQSHSWMELLHFRLYKEKSISFQVNN